MKKLGGPFQTLANWQTRYCKLYPNRLELHSDAGKPELIFMDQIEEIILNMIHSIVKIKFENDIEIDFENDQIFIIELQFELS